MTPQEIKNLIQQEIVKSNNNNRFNVNAIPQQKINIGNISNTPSQVFTYIGLVSFSYISGRNFSTLPSGWVVQWQGNGQFELIHNLNTTLYSVVATANNANTAFAAATLTLSENTVFFNWYSSSNVPTDYVDTDFSFILVVVNNKKTSFPTYTALT